MTSGVKSNRNGTLKRPFTFHTSTQDSREWGLPRISLWSCCRHKTSLWTQSQRQALVGVSASLLLILAMIIDEETLLEQVLTGQKQKAKAHYGDGPRRK